MNSFTVFQFTHFTSLAEMRNHTTKPLPAFKGLTDQFSSVIKGLACWIYFLLLSLFCGLAMGLKVAFKKRFER